MLWPNHYNKHLGYRRNRGEREVESFVKMWQVAPEVFGIPSDRAAVIVAVALIDGAVGDLLKQAFHKLADERSDTERIEKECKSLLDPDKSGMLAGATARARMAYVMGMLDQFEYEAIKETYIVRNGMAHKETAPAISRSMADCLYNKLPPSGKTFVKKLVDAQAELESQLNKGMPEDKQRKRSDAAYRFLACCLVYWIRVRGEMQAMECYVRKDGPNPPRPRPARKPG